MASVSKCKYYSTVFSFQTVYFRFSLLRHVFSNERIHLQDSRMLLPILFPLRTRIHPNPGRVVSAGFLNPLDLLCLKKQSEGSLSHTFC